MKGAVLAPFIHSATRMLFSLSVKVRGGGIYRQPHREVHPILAHYKACSRKGYQLICKTDWLKLGINIERLRKIGLVFILDQYTKVHIECTN